MKTEIESKYSAWEIRRAWALTPEEIMVGLNALEAFALEYFQQPKMKRTAETIVLSYKARIIELTQQNRLQTITREAFRIEKNKIVFQLIDSMKIFTQAGFELSFFNMCKESKMPLILRNFLNYVKGY